MITKKTLPTLCPCPRCGAEQSINDLTGVFFVQHRIFINGAAAVETTVCCGNCHRNSEIRQMTTSSDFEQSAIDGLNLMAKAWSEECERLRSYYQKKE